MFFAAILVIAAKVAILKESTLIKLISVLVTFRDVSKTKFPFCRSPRNFRLLDKSLGSYSKISM